jgi:hypothetical protein
MQPNMNNKIQYNTTQYEPYNTIHDILYGMECIVLYSMYEQYTIQ